MAQEAMAAATGAYVPVAAPSVETRSQFDVAWASDSQELARRWKYRRVNVLADEAAAELQLCKVRALGRPCTCWLHFRFK